MSHQRTSGRALVHFSESRVRRQLASRQLSWKASFRYPHCIAPGIQLVHRLRSRVPSPTLDGGKVSLRSRESDSVKTAAELFSASFEGDYEDEQPWDAVGVLRRRNSDEVFQLAAAYCRSDMSIHRARALDVLAQLGAGRPLSERPHFSESVALAVARLRDEDPLVVHSAAWALAHLNDSIAVAALIEITTLTSGRR